MSSLLPRAFDAAARDLEVRLAAEEQRDVELTEAEKWARDPLGWINAHVWIASPFTPNATVPTSLEQWLQFDGKLRPVRMRLFDDQAASLAAWIDLDRLRQGGEAAFRNAAFEKSRQIGETWGFAALICWLLHYHDITVGVMHKRSAEVDDGGDRSTWRSIFGKVRYIDRRLDRQRIPGLGRLAFRPFSREPAKIENLDRGAVVYGEGQTDDPFRGMTLDAFLGDEAAFIEHGEKVYAAIDEACPNGKALLSTVNGDGNFHARIVDEKPAGYQVLRLHWSRHPIYSRGLHVAALPPDDGQPGRHAPQPRAQLELAKACALCAGAIAGRTWSAEKPVAHRFPGKPASPWYDWRVIGKTLEQVANELDIDREAALGGRVYREFASPVHIVETGIAYDPMLQLELAIDYGLDTTSVLFLQDAPLEVRVIGIVEMGDQHDTSATPEKVAAELRRYAVETLGVPARHATPEWTAKWSAVGDPAGHSRTQETGRPFVLAYRRLGFVFGRPPSRLTRSVDPGITAVKRLLLGSPKPLRICGVKADALGLHLRNNTWPTDATGARRLGSTRPEDDVHNHACDALRYWTLARYPPVGERQHIEPPPFDDEPAGPADPLAYRRRARDEHAPLPYGATL